MTRWSAFCYGFCLAILLSLIGCEIETKPAAPNPHYMSLGDTELKVITFDHHEYIIAKYDGFKEGSVSIVHHQGCPCLQKAEKEQ